MAPRPTPQGRADELGYLLAEIDKLRIFLQEVRLDFGAIRPASIKDLHIPRARDHLGEVVRSTGNAASEIIDACEAIQAVAGEIGGEAANRIQEGQGAASHRRAPPAGPSHRPEPARRELMNDGSRLVAVMPGWPADHW